MVHLKRLDGADYMDVVKEGFRHVDGKIFDVPIEAAYALVKEAPEIWCLANKVMIEEEADPDPAPVAEKPISPMSTATSAFAPGVNKAEAPDERKTDAGAVDLDLEEEPETLDAQDKLKDEPEIEGDEVLVDLDDLED